jgi:hypothetical protein
MPLCVRYLKANIYIREYRTLLYLLSYKHLITYNHVESMQFVYMIAAKVILQIEEERYLKCTFLYGKLCNQAA